MKTTSSCGRFFLFFSFGFHSCVKSTGARLDVTVSIRSPAALARSGQLREGGRYCRIRSEGGGEWERGDVQVGGRSE